MPLQGVAVNMVYIFPSTVNPHDLERFFTRQGVKILNIVQGTVVRGKIVPAVRTENVTLRRSARIAAKTQKKNSSYLAGPSFLAEPTFVAPTYAYQKGEPLTKKKQANWIVAVIVHYPNPMLEITREIERKFGKNVVKRKNFTDYDAIIPTMTGLQLTAPVVTHSENSSMNGEDDSEMDELAGLFGRQAVGGLRRRVTRKRRTRTRKTKRRSSRN